jgi:hypothetical protein
MISQVLPEEKGNLGDTVLPCAGIILIRFNGFFSALVSTQSTPEHCKIILSISFKKIIFEIFDLL